MRFALRPVGLAYGLAIALMLAGIAAGCAGGPPTTSTTRPPDTTSSIGASTTTTEQPVVRIGSLFPLTGDLAERGAECAAGVQLAVNEVNAAGGIRSLGGVRLEVVEADSEGKPDIGVARTEDLVKKDHVSAIVGAYQSTVALPVSQAVEAMGTPLVLSVGAADKLTEQGLKFTFRLCAKADWYARAQVQFLSDPTNLGGLNVTKVALLHEDGDFGEATAASQKKYLAEAGIAMVMEQTYSATTADVHEQVLAIKSSGAEAILTATYLSDALLIADAYQKLTMQLPVLDAAGGTVDPEFVEKLGAGADGFLTELDYSAGQKGATEVAARFKAAYGYEMSANALYSYQAVWVIADALERTASSDPQRLRDSIAATSMLPGEHMVLPQTVLDFDAKGQNRFAQLFVAQIQSSKMVCLWPQDYATGAVRLNGAGAAGVNP